MVSEPSRMFLTKTERRGQHHPHLVGLSGGGMLDVVAALAAPIRRTSYGIRKQSQGWLVRPVGTPVAHAPGPAPDRILILGNGLANGWGVRTHDLALGGHLARSLAAATRRGADVRTAADPSVTIKTASTLLAGTAPEDFDAVVIVLGASDAFRLTPSAVWANHMHRLLSALREAAPAVPVVVLGISPLSEIKFFHTRPGGLADTWADRLNDITVTLCREFNVAYTPPVRFALGTERRPEDQRYRGPDEYAPIATGLADAVAPLLLEPSDRHDSHGRGIGSATEARLRALSALPPLESPLRERLDRIVRSAATVFGTSGAAFTLLDEATQWYGGSVGVEERSTPIEESFCATTIQSPDPLIVNDAHHDARPVPKNGSRFYAGHPVEAPDGTRIGAICVFDDDPRTVSSSQMSFLEQLAHAIERELASLT